MTIVNPPLNHNTATPAATPAADLRRATDIIMAVVLHVEDSADGTVLQPSRHQDSGSTVQQQQAYPPRSPPALEASDSAWHVEASIAVSLDHDKTSGLVNWILNVENQEKAVDHMIKLQGYMHTRHGNFVRSEFHSLLEVYMAELDIPNESADLLFDVCGKLTTALEPKPGSKDQTLKSAAFAVKHAMCGIRAMTNEASHLAKLLSDAKVHVLCGYFHTFAEAMPTLVAEFQRRNASSPTEADELFTLIANLSPEKKRQVRELVITLDTPQSPSAANSMVSLNNATPVMTLSPTRAPAHVRGWEMGPSRPTTPPTPPVWSRGSPILKTTISATSPSRFEPSQAAQAVARTLQLYYNRPTELSPETDPTRKMMFKFMLEHVNMVAKASLCDLACSGTNCPKSHSYEEVMSYNPLYKLFVCRQHYHFWGCTVAEDNGCVCVHVDTRLNVLDRTWQSKRKRCPLGASCSNDSCIKSHSLEESCWFNPSYKTAKCTPSCHRLPIECCRAHDGETVRVDEADFVGKNVRMHFIERTHKELADALEAVRYVRRT